MFDATDKNILVYEVKAMTERVRHDVCFRESGDGETG